MRTNLLITIYIFLGLLIAAPLTAQNVVELEASKDNTLYENNTNDAVLSNGAGQHFFAGMNGTSEVRRGIVQFDLSGVPEGSQIESAELRLYLNRTATTAAKSVELYEVLKNWGEGTSDGSSGEGRGADATTGDATWAHTFYPDETWDSPGGDFGSTLISAFDIEDVGSYTWPSTPEFVALVQKWLDTPGDNHGLILTGDEEVSSTAKRFSSRQNDTVEQRPVLVVEYTGEVTSVDLTSERPQSVQLFQNYPNPFNPTTTIAFSVPEAIFAEISVYDMLGRKLETLLSETVQAGKNTVTFDASDLSSGVYLFTLRTGEQSLTRRMTILK